MKHAIIIGGLALFLTGTTSCSNNEKRDLNKYIISNLNQDIANKTMYAASEAEVDLQTLQRFANKVDSNGNLYTKINDVNNTVKKISKIIDSHLEWIKNNDEASVESFYSNDNLKEEYEEIQTLMKQLNNDFFQLVNNNTYLTKYKSNHNENSIKHLHELLNQCYHSEEGECTIEAFETDCRILKLNLYLALEKLNELVLENLHGDGMVLNTYEGKVLFDVATNKDSIQCKIFIDFSNDNIEHIIYLGKIDKSKFKDGEKISKSGAITEIPIIGNYKKLVAVNGSVLMNISNKDFFDKQIEGVIEVPDRSGSRYLPFKRNSIRIK
jgi:hypothetical protein